MIYTSYFSKLKYIENPISICGKAPDWYKGPQAKFLAPKFWFFDKYKKSAMDKDAQDEYTKYYKLEVLDKLDPYTTLTELWSHYITNEDFDVNNPPIITLICFEKPEDFCHRHLIAEWLIKSGYKVEEKTWIS